jgi:hypothetical protein
VYLLVGGATCVGSEYPMGLVLLFCIWSLVVDLDRLAGGLGVWLVSKFSFYLVFCTCV